MNAITQSLTRSENGLIGLQIPAFSFAQLAKLIRLWSQRAEQRRHLTTLTNRELEDVGISASAAAAEAAKPFWRA